VLTDSLRRPNAVSVILSSPRSSPLQSKIPAKLDSEFIHYARFAPGWHFGEPQPIQINGLDAGFAAASIETQYMPFMAWRQVLSSLV
jgi:hypothetical protein